MSRLSFKTFCIEFYAEHIQTESSEVNKMFEQSGLLEMLDTDYEDSRNVNGISHAIL